MQVKQAKYCQPLYRMVKNLYYCWPHFDLNSWTIDNIDTKHASAGPDLDR